MSTVSDITEMKQDIKTILNHLGRFESHVENLSIHQLPPCKFHENLSGKLWAIAAAAVTALAHSVYTGLQRGN